MFDNNSMIDIDALESFVSTNRDSLASAESVLKIDIDQLMTVKENAASIRAQKAQIAKRDEEESKAPAQSIKAVQQQVQQ